MDVRPIGADALNARFEELKNHPKNTLKDIVFLNGAMSVVDAAPTLDLAPVVHGEWIEHDEENPWPLEWRYHCSLCGCQEYFARNYCHNCGAKMDGGKENG